MLDFFPDFLSFGVGVEKTSNHVHLEESHEHHGKDDDCAEKAHSTAV